MSNSRYFSGSFICTIYDPIWVLDVEKEYGQVYWGNVTADG